MCFSPTASFVASAALSVTGVICLSRARNTAQKTLACIPLIFSFQQFTEGVLWMALMHPSWAHWQYLSTYGFQVFAQMFWPVWIPLCILLFERHPVRKKLIAVLLCAGIVLAVYTGYCLWKYPVHAIAAMHHIRYESGFPLADAWFYGLLYFVPTILAPLISSVKRLRWLAYMFLISYVVARLFFHYYEISVWCFFGAVISIIVLLIINLENRDSNAR
jgi:hypothetical protein